MKSLPEAIYLRKGLFALRNDPYNHIKIIKMFIQ